MSCNCENDKRKRNDFSIAKAISSGSTAIMSAVKAFSLKDYNPMASKEVADDRMRICRECDNHILTLGKSRCNICGCFLKAKTSLKDQSCPHPEGPKWQEET